METRPGKQPANPLTQVIKLSRWCLGQLKSSKSIAKPIQLADMWNCKQLLAYANMRPWCGQQKEWQTSPKAHAVTVKKIRFRCRFRDTYAYGRQSESLGDLNIPRHIFVGVVRLRSPRFAFYLLLSVLNIKRFYRRYKYVDKRRAEECVQKYLYLWL